MLMNQVKKAYSTWKNEGPDMLFYKVKLKLDMKNVFRRSAYSRWVEANERDIMDVEELKYNPLFSVVIPVYNVADNMLRECIDSVLGQTYRNFEIVLVDDASTQKSVRKVLGEYEGRPGITVIYRQKNGHISRTTNDGIQAAKGEFVALCDCDDLYAPNALYEIARKLNEDPSLDYIYSDEDKISENGKKRSNPFFKPDWSPETFMSFMYTCHLSVFRKTLLDEISGLRTGFEGSQDYDLVLRVMEKTTRIGHVPKILYHWRMRTESTANALAAKPYALDAAARAKEEALKRRGQKGKVTLIPAVSQHRVTYFPQGNPMVSIIIPSKDNPDILSMCLAGILKHTDYQNYEIVVVDNGSSDTNRKKIEGFIEDFRKSGGHDIRYLYQPKDFNFSAMCNQGAAAAKGDFLLFLNDDIEVSASIKKSPYFTAEVSQWLSILAGQAQVSYTGAVSCKLYYPDGNTIQHAGVVNLTIGPAHCLYGFSDSFNYYYGRNLLDYNCCSVTGACLMIGREKFDEAGGFDEELPVAYNDVALCFRLVELGYFNVVRNDVMLLHHESVSRGLDRASAVKEERRAREMKKLYEKHPEFTKGYDPCYNPNLVSDRVDFSFDMKYASDHEKVKRLPEKESALLRCVDPEKKILVYHLDFVEERGELVQINGWIYNSRKKSNNHNKVNVLLKKETGEMYSIKTTRSFRPDLQEANMNIKELSLAGFETIFSSENLPRGKYKVGLELDKLYVMCKSWLEL